MATKVTRTVKHIDDLNGQEYQRGETIPFSFEGESYTIDLNQRNADTFRRLMQRYVDAAQNNTPKPKFSTFEAVGRSSAIRVWAKNNGIYVSRRGRVPSDVIHEYDRAMAWEATKTAIKVAN